MPIARFWKAVVNSFCEASPASAIAFRALLSMLRISWGRNLMFPSLASSSMKSCRTSSTSQQILVSWFDSAVPGLSPCVALGGFFCEASYCFSSIEPFTTIAPFRILKIVPVLACGP